MPNFKLNSTINYLPSVFFSSHFLETNLNTDLLSGFGFVSYGEFSSVEPDTGYFGIRNKANTYSDYLK